MVEQSEKKQKREYRKGNPLTPTEYTNRYKDRKKKTNKEMRIFIPIDLGNNFTEHCREIGMSRSDVIANLVENYMNFLDSNSCAD